MYVPKDGEHVLPGLLVRRGVSREEAQRLVLRRPLLRLQGEILLLSRKEGTLQGRDGLRREEPVRVPQQQTQGALGQRLDQSHNEVKCSANSFNPSFDFFFNSL